MENQIEIWKDITGYEGIYQVSNFGNIKSFLLNKEKILKPQINSTGYYVISLRKEEVPKTYKIHRLLAIEFIPNPNNLEMVNHIDGNKLNNHYTNLEWTSRRENVIHGLKKKKQTSKYCGVSFCKKDKKYKSFININNRKIYLGTYSSEIEAYNSRVNFEKENGIKNKYL